MFNCIICHNRIPCIHSPDYKICKGCYHIDRRCPRNIQHHLRMHHANAFPYFCYYCDSAFTTLEQMNEHSHVEKRTHYTRVPSKRQPPPPPPHAIMSTLNHSVVATWAPSPPPPPTPPRLFPSPDLPLEFSSNSSPRNLGLNELPPWNLGLASLLDGLMQIPIVNTPDFCHICKQQFPSRQSFNDHLLTFGACKPR